MKIIIVGGGIIGASTSLLCAEHDHEVLLLEKEVIGSGASSAAAGILSPPSFFDPDQTPETQNAHALLGQKSYEYYPTFLEVLDQWTRIDPDYHQTGTWYVSFDEAEQQQLKSYAREMKKFDHPVSWTPPDELRKEVPWIGPDVIGGYFEERDASIRPDVLMKALRDALINHPDITVEEHMPVAKLELSKGVCQGVKTPEKTVEGDRTILTAGSWIKQFDTSLQQPLPVKPRKGERLRVEMSALAGEPMLRWDAHHVIPRPNGDVDIGATVEDQGYNSRRTDEGREEIFQWARTMVHKLQDQKVKDHWVGLRPYACMKGGPFLGTIPGYQHILIGAGHYKEGILQGPYSAHLLTQLINDSSPDIPLQPYGLDR